MKLAIFGAGAIGGYLGVKLALAGVDVTMIARGPHLAAMREKGVTLESEGETLVAHPFATDDPAAAGPQDFVVVTVKAHSLPAAARQMQPLLGPETAVVSAMNGVPWWYFYRHGDKLEGTRLKSVDPDGSLWESLAPERAIGCIVYPAADVVAPGVIRHIYSNRFAIGEPDGAKSARVQALSKAMIGAGLKCPVRPRIRDDIWLKLWGNLCFNPISALTCATLDVIASDPGTRGVARAMMVEAQAAAEALGIHFPLTVDQRIEGALEVGAHKTSMLQDLERGRPMEIEALLGAVVEMAALVQVPSPICSAVLAMVRQRARVAGCYPE